MAGRAKPADAMRRSRASAALVAIVTAALIALAGSRGAAAPPSKAGLPRLASTVLPAPEPSSTQELDQALSLVSSSKSADQEQGMLLLKEGGTALLPAISRKLSELRKSANRETIGTLVTEARKSRKGKSDKKKSGKAQQAQQDSETDGWLPLVLANPKPGEPAYRDLVAVLAMERALVEMGNTAAVRELIAVYTYFGDLFRIDVQHMIARLGDRAVPALLEARKHDVEKVRSWASRQLDTLGKAVPGETVQIVDPEVLADVLRAYGRTKELDALRVIISFTSSDRAGVRDAAREALVSYGEAALWQLREAHETMTGKRPPTSLTWDQLAREMFEAHDRARFEEIIGLFDEGLAKQKDGKLEEMAQSFDSVLARVPTFERRAEMIDGYIAFSRQLESKDLPRALLYARKALRLDPQGPGAKGIESYVLTIEGEDQVARGLIDTAIFKRALEIDPANARAREVLAKLEQNPAARPHDSYRYLAAAVIAVIAVAAALVVGVRRKPTPSDPQDPSEPDPLLNRRRDEETDAPVSEAAPAPSPPPASTELPDTSTPAPEAKLVDAFDAAPERGRHQQHYESRLHAPKPLVEESSDVISAQNDDKFYDP